MNRRRFAQKACIGLIIIIINFLTVSNVFSTTYYIDATSGDDTKDGQSPSTAWKTVSKVNRLSLNPGDSILLKRGEIWEGEYININQSGLSGNLITIGAYGTGARPILDGTGAGSVRGILFGDWETTDVGYIKIENLEVRNYGGDGICGAPGDVGAHHFIIKNVYIHRNGGEGIVLYVKHVNMGGTDAWMTQAGFHYLENCQSDYNGNHGFKIYGKDNTIINCSGAYNGQVYIQGAGLQLPTWGVGTHTVTGGSYYNNGGRGIRIASNWGGAVVTNVETYGNGRDGIELTEDVSNVVISNAITHDNAWNGIWINYTASNIDIIGCTSYGNDDSGIRIEGNNNNIKIKNCEIYSNTDEGIMVYRGSPTDVTITYNQVYNNGSYGLRGENVVGLTVLNNTFYGNRNGGYSVYFNTANNVLLKNNILRTLYSSGSSVSSDYNLYYGIPPDVINGNTTLAEYFSATGNAEHSLTGNPLFTSAENGIFTLTSESPAIDAGTNVGLTEDFAGNSVPSGVSPDIGAYEYLSTTTTAPTIDFVILDPNNGYAKIGDSVTITVIARNSEAGLTPSNVTINSKQIPLVDQGDGTYVGIYTVVDGDNDATNVEATNITLTGEGGTSAPASSSGSTLIVDAHKPIISSVTISPNSGLLKVGDGVVITVTAVNNESGLTPSDATINGKSIPLTDQGNGTYTGIYTVSADDNQGVNIEAENIILTDAAGNVSETASSTGSTLMVDTQANATIYYIDATSGDDTKDGQSPSTAWKTISKVNSITYNPVESFKPGDSILFKRGEVWEGENLIINNSGSPENLITIGAYGTGARPILDGTGAGSVRGILFGDWETTDVGYIKIENLEVRNYGVDGICGAPGDVGAHHFIIKNVYIHHNGGEGIVLYVKHVNMGGTDAWMTQAGFHYLENCQSDYNGNHGFKLYGKDNTIINCSAAYNGQVIDYCCGLQLPTWGVGMHTITGGSYHDNGGSGIRIASNWGGGIISDIECYGNGRNGIDITEVVSNVTVSRTNTYNNTWNGIWINSDVSDVDILNCNSYGNDDSGIRIERNANNVKIRNCKLYSNIEEGIKVYLGYSGGTGPTDVTMEYNQVYNNSGYGLHGENVVGLTALNNTFYGNKSGGYDVYFKSTASNVLLKNNILSSLYSNGGSVFSDYNLYYGTPPDVINGNTTLAEYFSATGNAEHSLTGNPLFTSAGNGIFTLTSESPAIDAGTNVGLMEDFAGTSVPSGVSSDIGAYEYLSTTIPVPIIDFVILDPNNGYVKIGDSVTITMIARNNEAGLTPSNATINSKQVTLVDQGDGTYVGIYTIAEGDNDAANVEATNVTLTGEGGTSAPASSSGSTLIVDAHKPIISSVTISPNSGLLKVGDGVAITVTAVNNESGLTPSDATINGKIIPLTDQGNGTYTEIYTVGADDNQGVNIEAANITLTDAAGNMSETASSTGSTLMVDTQAPGIASVMISPNSGLLKVGDGVTITVTAVNNESGLTPSDAAINGKFIPLTDQGNGTYTGTYTVGADDNQGVNIEAANITLTDAAGNMSETASSTGSTLSVDTQPSPSPAPTVVSVTINPNSGKVKIGDSVTITVTASNNEAGLTPSSATINSKQVPLVDQGDGTYVGIYTVAEDDNDATNVEATNITLAGEGGTSAPASSSGSTLIVDAHKPIISSVTISPNSGWLKSGDFVTITVTAVNNESGLNSSDATINGKSIPLTDRGDGTYTGIYTIGADDNQGVNIEATNVTLTDAAGNVSETASSTGSTLKVDTQAHGIASVTISPNSGWLKSGDGVTITVTALNNESGLTPSDATINGKSIPLTDRGDGTYTGIYMVGADDNQGVNIEAENIILSDAAGVVSETASSTGSTLKVDTQVPGIASVTISPNSEWLISGDSVIITVTAVNNESGLTSSDATINGKSIPLNDQGDGTYTGTYTVGADDNQGVNIEATNITLTDAAGNVSNAASATRSYKYFVLNQTFINFIDEDLDYNDPYIIRDADSLFVADNDDSLTFVWSSWKQLGAEVYQVNLYSGNFIKIEFSKTTADTLFSFKGIPGNTYSIEVFPAILIGEELGIMRSRAILCTSSIVGTPGKPYINR